MKKIKIEKIAILGATHGNESIGLQLIKNWTKNPDKIQRSTIKSDAYIANIKAAKQNRRYVDQDLNRSFSLKDLHKKPKNYEQTLAKKLNKILGPKASKKENYDFIIDLHSSTANMGITIIITDNDPYSILVAKILKEKFPEIKILTLFEDRLTQPYITSIAKHALTIEVGPIPQGAIFAETIFATQKIVFEILNIIENLNNLKQLPIKSKIECYNYITSIDYPKNSLKEIAALIHPKIQGKDFQPIKIGNPIFIDFNQEEICYDGKYGEIIHPVFIGEVAYIEKQIAMMFTKKIML